MRLDTLKHLVELSQRDSIPEPGVVPTQEELPRVQ